MKNLLSLILSKDDVIMGKKVSQTDIINAEKELGLEFSNEYRKYLMEFGCIAFDGREFTGICDIDRLNVVCVTNDEKKFNQCIPINWYVIEQANIDGIVIWQSSTGEIYQTSPNSKPIKLCDSLSEYIDM